jgi:hypothetical protein
MNDQDKAGFYYGAGLVGMLAGVGLLEKKWALLLGLGALYMGHKARPVVEVEALPGWRDVLPEAPELPSLPAGWQNGTGGLGRCGLRSRRR